MFASAVRRSLPPDARQLLGGKTPASSRRELGMTTFQTETTDQEHRHCCGSGPPADVIAWRRCRLVEAGFPPGLATRLASTRRIDLHALLQLVDRGCPPELAARILAPVDEEPQR